MAVIVTSAAAAVAGIPHPVALPPCVAKLEFPRTRISLLLPGVSGWSGNLVSATRHGATGT
jgi:hypothetical protein